MEYTSLISMYYTLKEKSKYNAEVDRRTSSHSTVKTGLTIKPIEKGNRMSNKTYELFYLPIKENSFLEYTIMENSKKIQKLVEPLPGSAQGKLMSSYIIDEIQSSNDIEGVKSTRKEIGDALQNIDSGKMLRFKGIARKYRNFINKEFERIEDVGKFREIYDELFQNDIASEFMPDGKIFRKENVFISTGTKTVHQGNVGEQSIIEDMGKLVIFMNRKDLTPVIKAIITHYYFEYIHPFYDGNGRMGRFIMSSYLVRKLDLFTGICLSNSVYRNKDKYHAIFADASNWRNHGDLTLFIQNMMKIIVDGQDKLIVELIALNEKLEYANGKIKKLKLAEDCSEILYIITQSHLFDISKQPITDKEIETACQMSRYLVKNALNELVEKGLIIQLKKRPSCHVLSEQMEKALT